MTTNTIIIHSNNLFIVLVMISPSKMQVVSLDAVLQTKISNVNVYSGLAEVTRTCRTNLQQGDSKVVISGLPNLMLTESLR